MATPDVAGKVPYSEEALADLRMRIRGNAIPGKDPGAEGVREAFNAMHRGTPAIVVSASGTQDVVDAVNFARDRNLRLCVRGGGHSVAGLSTTDGGMLLDLSQLHGVHVDPERRRVTVGGGALWGDVDRETAPFNLAVPGGVVSDTGVAGLTLGGGYGWLRRPYGLSCDSLVEATVVTADGKVRMVSADHEPDLFWALRGGGGNFGVVTDFTFEAHPLPETVAFAAIMYPLEDVAAVQRNWRSYVESAPDAVTSVIVTLTFPADPNAPEVVHNRPVAVVAGVYAGDVEAGMAEMQPLRELGEPLFDMSGPTPWVGVQSGFDPLFPRQQLSTYWKSQYLDALPDEAIDVLAERANDRPAPLTLVNTFHMGGAINRVDPEATAFAERSAPYMVSIDGMWETGDATRDAAGVAWVRDTWGRVLPYGNGGVYLNFTGDNGDELAAAAVDSAFGRNQARLKEIKAAYDPGNVFRVNHNIIPRS
jgi:FAD/FMN-containing dehydrogenase